MNLHDWANRWGIPFAAFRDLQITLGVYTPTLAELGADIREAKSEAFAQSLVRLEAAEKGVKLFRNNVGALQDDAGRVVRYGLANDSKAMNDVIKSGDLIGLRPVMIEPRHVGTLLGQFVSREVKKPGWQYSGAGREPAQLAWANLVNSCGGDAAFATGKGTL